MTQLEQIQSHLKRHRTITSVQAFARYGVTRLADCIHKLRRRGVQVDTELVPHKTTRYARYRLLQKRNPLR